MSVCRAMSHNNETSKRSRLSTPSPQNLSVNVASSLHSSMPNLESQNKHTKKNNLSYNIIMNKSNLSQLTKNQLIELLLAKQKPVLMPRTKKVTPIPFPRKSVKQMVQNYENTIIKPPRQFADKPKVAPRLKKTSSAIQLIPRNNIIPPPKQLDEG